MSQFLRSFRRAPARILASVFAIVLAVGAIGMFAVPDVALSSTRDVAVTDRLVHVSADTTTLSDEELGRLDLSALPEIEAIEARLLRTVTVDGTGPVTFLGLDVDDQDVNLVSASSGRLPDGPDEVLVSNGMAEIGDVLTVGGRQLDVVGIGATSWWADSDVAYTDLGTARAITGIDGVNRVIIRLDDPTGSNLDAAVDGLRSALAANGAAFASHPETLPDGHHPIEEDLTTVSTMIGLLGVVASIVALILVASTSNTLIAERSHEVAVMRALGGRRRKLRRRLRAIALGIAVTGGSIGVVLGTVVANVIGRIVLQDFAGLTPDVGYSPTVIAASMAFAVVGAWLVSDRAIRRVTKRPLAEALRDRDANPFGQRFSERVVARIPVGGLFGRVATRAALHRRGRTVAVASQLSAGVAAVIVVASLGASVTSFDEAALEPWHYANRTTSVDPGLPLAATVADQDDRFESGIATEAELDGTSVDLYGLDVDTAAFDPTVEEGTWFASDRRQAVLPAGFARQHGIGVGDTIGLDLASGPVRYEVSGLHRARLPAVFAPTEVVAGDLGAPGHVNTVYALGAAAEVSTLDLPTDVSTETVTAQELEAEGEASRALIIDVFYLIGGVVAGVSLLGVGAAMAVAVHERRRELATLQAIGARRSQIRRLLLSEVAPLALAAAAVGSVAGWFGAHGIITAFENAEGIEIGTVFAAEIVPLVVVGAVVAVCGIAVLAVRRTGSQPPAVTLRTGS